MNVEEVRIIRLKSGEDIVGYVSDISEMKIHIRTPMAIEIKSDTQTMKQMFLIRSWLPHQLIENNEATLWTNDILLNMEPNAKFIQYYVESVIELERLITMKEIMEYLQNEDEISEAMDELKSSQVH